MTKAKNIEELIKKLRYDTSSQMYDRIFDNVLQAQEQSEQQKSAATRPNIWRMIMKTKITKFAAAAVLIIAVLIGINQFGSSIDGASVAWGQLVERVDEIKTYTFQGYISQSGLPNMPEGKTIEVEIVVYSSSEYGSRMETYGEGKLLMIMHMLPQEKIGISVMPSQKKYTRMTLTDEQFCKMRQQGNDPKEMVKKFMSADYKELGRDTIDSIEVEGIEVTDPTGWGGMFDSFLGRIWVDIETELPVQIEMEFGSEQIEQKMVLDQFQWDIELDPTLFEPNIPGDYTLMAEVQMPDASDEGKLIQGLRTFAELTGGRYPSDLSMMNIMKEVGEALRKDIGFEPNREPDPEQTQKMMDKMMLLQTPSHFCMQLIQENKDPAYYGDKVSTEDTDLVLLRWKISEDEYRVIFGDLTTANVTTEQLAELEANLPQ
jgi:outer membrane lipoprotein-sorting protein